MIKPVTIPFIIILLLLSLNGKSRTAGLALTRPSPPPAPLSQLWERGEVPRRSPPGSPLSQSWETRQRLGGEGRFWGVLVFPFGLLSGVLYHALWVQLGSSVLAVVIDAPTANYNVFLPLVMNSNQSIPAPTATVTGSRLML